MCAPPDGFIASQHAKQNQLLALLCCGIHCQPQILLHVLLASCFDSQLLGECVCVCVCVCLCVCVCARVHPASALMTLWESNLPQSEAVFTPSWLRVDSPIPAELSQRYHDSKAAPQSLVKPH